MLAPTFLLKTLTALGLLCALAGCLSTQQSPQVRSLLKGLESPEANIREESLTRLTELGHQGIAPLEKALAHKNPEIRSSAAYGLLRLAPIAEAAIDGLLRALEDPNEEVRTVALEALGRMGAPAYPLLLETLLSPSELQRENAGKALAASIDSWDRDDMFQLVEAFAQRPESGARQRLEGVWREGESKVSQLALRLLSEAALDSPAMIESLTITLQTGRGWDIAYALKALTLIGPRAQGALPAIEPLMQEDSRHVRIPAAEAVTALGDDERGLVVLDRDLGSHNVHVRTRAIGSLKNLGKKARFAAAALIRVAVNRDEKQDLRFYSLLTLAQSGLKESTDRTPLLKLAADPEAQRNLRELSLFILGRDAEGSPAFSALLNRLVTATNPELKAAATCALVMLGRQDKPLDALESVLRDGEGLSYYMAARILGEMGPAAARSVPALVSALDEGELPVTTAAAAEALRKIQVP